MFCGIFWMDYEFSKSLKFIINLIKRDLFCYYYLLIECFDKSWSFSCNVVCCEYIVRVCMDIGLYVIGFL